MRNIRISEGEYYHIFNRGMSKQIIFLDKNDHLRFLFLVLFFQSPMNFPNIHRMSKDFVQHSVLNIDKQKSRYFKKRGHRQPYTKVKILAVK